MSELVESHGQSAAIALKTNNELRDELERSIDVQTSLNTELAKQVELLLESEKTLASFKAHMSLQALEVKSAHDEVTRLKGVLNETGSASQQRENEWQSNVQELGKLNDGLKSQIAQVEADKLVVGNELTQTRTLLEQAFCQRSDSELACAKLKSQLANAESLREDAESELGWIQSSLQDVTEKHRASSQALQAAQNELSSLKVVVSKQEADLAKERDDNVSIQRELEKENKRQVAKHEAEIEALNNALAKQDEEKAQVHEALQQAEKVALALRTDYEAILRAKGHSESALEQGALSYSYLLLMLTHNLTKSIFLHQSTRN